jgi:hypothetical protein
MTARPADIGDIPLAGAVSRKPGVSAVLGISMDVTAGKPSSAGAERWSRRGEHLAAWLLDQWRREQHAQTSPRPLDLEPHPATPVAANRGRGGICDAA